MFEHQMNCTYVYQLSGSEFRRLSRSFWFELFVALDRMVLPSYFFIMHHRYILGNAIESHQKKNLRSIPNTYRSLVRGSRSPNFFSRPKPDSALDTFHKVLKNFSYMYFQFRIFFLTNSVFFEKFFRVWYDSWCILLNSVLLNSALFIYLFSVIFQRDCSTFSFDTHETLARADS